MFFQVLTRRYIFSNCYLHSLYCILQFLGIRTSSWYEWGQQPSMRTRNCSCRVGCGLQNFLDFTSKKAFTNMQVCLTQAPTNACADLFSTYSNVLDQLISRCQLVVARVYWDTFYGVSVIANLQIYTVKPRFTGPLGGKELGPVNRKTRQIEVHSIY